MNTGHSSTLQWNLYKRDYLCLCLFVHSIAVERNPYKGHAYHRFSQLCSIFRAGTREREIIKLAAGIPFQGFYTFQSFQRCVMAFQRVSQDSYGWIRWGRDRRNQSINQSYISARHRTYGWWGYFKLILVSNWRNVLTEAVIFCTSVNYFQEGRNENRKNSPWEPKRRMMTTTLLFGFPLWIVDQAWQRGGLFASRPWIRLNLRKVDWS